MSDKESTTVQVMPSPGGADIADLVRADIEARAELGLSRYGHRLQAGNGRDALADLYQEILDAAMYIRQLICERADRQTPK